VIELAMVHRMPEPHAVRSCRHSSPASLPELDDEVDEDDVDEDDDDTALPPAPVDDDDALFPPAPVDDDDAALLPPVPVDEALPPPPSTS
jgi:hypothetical protein